MSRSIILSLVLFAAAVLVMSFLSSGTGAVQEDSQDPAPEEEFEEFIPSEEIGADNAVSFPVDI